MGVDRVSKLPIACVAFRPCEPDANADGVEAGAHAVIEAKETAQIEIAVDVDLDLVEPDAELSGPD